MTYRALQLPSGLQATVEQTRHTAGTQQETSNVVLLLFVDSVLNRPALPESSCPTKNTRRKRLHAFQQGDTCESFHMRSLTPMTVDLAMGPVSSSGLPLGSGKGKLGNGLH